MKVALVNPGPYGNFQPPLGLGYLASYARQAIPGIEIKIFDENAGDDILAGVAGFAPALIGITATTPLMVDAIRGAEALKKQTGVPVILGGYHVSSIPEPTLRRHQCFDVAVLGEGEETFGELISLLAERGALTAERLASVAGIAYRDGTDIRRSPSRPPLSAEAMNLYPPPARDLMRMDFYLQPRDILFGTIKRATQVMTSRGCPYDCRFCGSKVVNNRRWRAYTPERVVAEVKSLVDTYGVEAVFFQDDMFSVDKKRAVKICEMLIEGGLHKKISWFYQERANFVDETLMRLYRKAGCVQVSFGFESGNERVLNYLKKDKSSVAQNQKALDAAHAAGLRVTPSFMIGNFGETREEIQDTLDFIHDNRRKMEQVQLYLATPYPGCAMWDDWVAENAVDIEKLDWSMFWMGLSGRKVYVSNKVDHGELERLYNRALLKLQMHYNLRPQYLLKKFLNNPVKFMSVFWRLLAGALKGGADNNNGSVKNACGPRNK